MNDDFGTIVFCGFCLITMFVAGMTVGSYLTDKEWQESALKAGVGEYSQQTAKFQWVNNKKDSL